MKYFIVNKIEEIQVKRKGWALDFAEIMFKVNNEKDPVWVYKIAKNGLKLIKHWEEKCKHEFKRTAEYYNRIYSETREKCEKCGLIREIGE